MAVFDGFCFFNELDLLEIRLNILKEVIDYFIIAESPVTFTGKPKPLYFHENKEYFKDWPIIHVVANPSPGDAWHREFWQRNAIGQGFSNKPEDVLIVSDVDEIPHPDAIKEFDPGTHSHAGPRVLLHRLSYYYLNCIALPGGSGGASRILAGHSFNHFERSANRVRYTVFPEMQTGVGWHFSYLGGIAKIKEKISAFSHTELDIDAYTSAQHLEQVINKGDDLFNRSVKYKVIDLDATFPAYVINNKNRFAHLLKANTSQS